MDNYETGIKEIGFNIQHFNITNYKYELVSFDSCDQLISKMQRGVADYNWNGKGHSDGNKSSGDSSSWRYGQLENYDKTLEYLTEGKVLDSVNKKATEVYNTLTNSPVIQDLLLRAATFKRKKVYSEDGADLDIDRVMCGDPLHWIKSTRGKKNSLIRLGVNLAGNCMEDENLFNNLTAVAGVVSDILSRAGFGVELSAVATTYGTTNKNWFNTVQVTLKKAEEALDLQRIYSVGCSGFFRCWIFKVYCNVLTGHPTGGLGQVRNINKEMQEKLELDYIIDSSFKDAKSQLIKIEEMFNEVVNH